MTAHFNVQIKNVEIDITYLIKKNNNSPCIFKLIIVCVFKKHAYFQLISVCVRAPTNLSYFYHILKYVFVTNNKIIEQQNKSINAFFKR